MTSTNVDAWFKSLEHWFRATGIHDEASRCDAVLASIEPNVLDQIDEQFVGVPDEGKFALVKRVLIAHYADSEQRKLNRLLSELPLGDKRPSELFFEMKKIAGRILGDSALKGLWIQRLPESARSVVAAAQGTPAEFTKMADSIVELLATPSVHQVAAGPLNEISELKAVVAELSKQMQKFSGRSRSHTRPSTSHRSRTPANNGNAADANAESDECWYHQKYGRNAQKCRSPCRQKTRSRSRTPAPAANNNNENASA